MFVRLQLTFTQEIWMIVDLLSHHHHHLNWNQLFQSLSSSLSSCLMLIKQQFCFFISSIDGSIDKDDDDLTAYVVVHLFLKFYFCYLCCIWIVIFSLSCCCLLSFRVFLIKTLLLNLSLLFKSAKQLSAKNRRFWWFLKIDLIAV